MLPMETAHGILTAKMAKKSWTDDSLREALASCFCSDYYLASKNNVNEGSFH